MLIEVSGPSTSAVIRNLHTVPELHALHATNGAWDLIAEIQAETLQDFHRVPREVRMVDGALNPGTGLISSTA